MDGLGSYFKSSPLDGVAMGAYYASPVPAIVAPTPILTKSIQPISSLAGTSGLSSFGTGSILTVVIAAAAGYFVGKQLGYPVAGAVATGLLGLPGMLGVAVYSSYKRKGLAVANRRRSRRRRSRR
ncbi:MAG: hypothetical protein WC683_02410 [bacterium]